MSENRSVGFKLVKHIYLIILVLGLIASIVLLVFGLFALSDNEDNTRLYENVMHYYGIDELDFEPVFNDTNLMYKNNKFSQGSTDKQHFLGTIMVFVGVVSILFEIIALIGAIKENIVITVTILVLMVIGTISGLCTIKSIDACSLITQLLFLALAALYVILLKKELNPSRSHSYNPDVEMNNSRNKNLTSLPIDQKYIDLKGGPPPYNEVDLNKNVI